MIKQKMLIEKSNDLHFSHPLHLIKKRSNELWLQQSEEPPAAVTDFLLYFSLALCLYL